MSDKENVVQQAQMWAQEARTQRAIVLSILRYFGLPERDYEALSLIQAKVEAVAAEWDACFYENAIGGDIDIGAAIRRALATVIQNTAVDERMAAQNSESVDGYVLRPRGVAGTDGGEHK